MKRELQVKLVLGVVAAALMSFFLVLVDYYFTFGRQAGWSLDMLGVFLQAQKMPVIQLVVFVCAMVIVMLKLSHRVAGPLVNLEQSFRRVGDGDLTTRLQLRPHDELKDVRDSFNAMMGLLNRQVVADRSRAGEVIRIIEQVASSNPLTPPQVAEMNRAIALLRTLTAEFKL